MTTQCPFCEIGKGGSQSTVLHRDDTVLAFLDTHPIQPGHALVVPVRHEPDFFSLPDDVLAALMQVAKRIANAQKLAFQPKRIGMLVAGFDIAHAHLHVVPMRDYHDLTSRQMLEGGLARAPAAELAAGAEKIRRYLGQQGR